MADSFRNLLVLYLLAACQALAYGQYTPPNEKVAAALKSSFDYAQATDYIGYTVTLKADIYKPIPIQTKRPVVLLYHGGGYVSSDRNQAILKPFIDALTNAGISAIASDFRFGWPGVVTDDFCKTVTKEWYQDAAYRSYQDNRALIRYCKANANNLGIDSNKIFLLGISSGGALVLHHLYFQQEMAGEKRIQNIGELNNSGNKLTNSVDVAGIISVVGGFYQKDFVPLNSTPILLFNNTCDAAVDFTKGWLGNCSNTVPIYGPGTILPILNQYSHPYQLHVFCGFNHSFQSISSGENIEPLAMQYMTKKTIDFIKNIGLYQQEESTCIASDSIKIKPAQACENFETFYWCNNDTTTLSNPYISITPNPLICQFSPKLNIQYPSAETLYMTIINAGGSSIIKQKEIECGAGLSVIYLNSNDFATGVNIVILKDRNGKTIYQTKVMRYCEF